MIEINSQKTLKDSQLDSETKFIAGLIMDLLSTLFETDNFSDHASLFVICDEKDFDNYRDMHLYEKISPQSFEFVDEILVSDSGNSYLLGCIVPSDDFGIYLLLNSKYNNLNLEKFSNSRKIILDGDSTYKNFLKVAPPTQS